VIGTLSLKAAEQGFQSIIVTSDKDMLQLVSENILVLDAMKDNTILTNAGWKRRWASSLPRFPTCWDCGGDTVDNIPARPASVKKGAKELIQTYGHPRERAEKLGLRSNGKTYQESLRDNAELIRMSRELVTIRRDLPIDLDLKSLILCEPDRKGHWSSFPSWNSSR